MQHWPTMISSVRGLHSLTILIPMAVAAACSAGGNPGKTIGAGAAGGAAGASGVGGIGGISGVGGAGGAGGIITPNCTTGCQDFPRDPTADPGITPDLVSRIFGNSVDPGTINNGVCVLEPQLSGGNAPGAMFPANWLRPRFRFEAPGDIFEIRIKSAVQANELVHYTKSKTWYFPGEIWKKAAANNGGKPMTVTIRAGNSAAPGPVSGTQGDFLVAPVAAGGSMVFWTVKDSNVTPESSKLYGFAVGEEGVVEALRSKGGTTGVQFNQVLEEQGINPRAEYCMNSPNAEGCKPGFSPGDVQCIGCHTSTPDGESVIFVDDWPWNSVIASVKPQSAGQVPPYVTPGARALLKMPWLGTPTMSPAFWGPTQQNMNATGPRLVVTTWGARGANPFSSGTGCKPGQVTCSGERDKLIWINLETNAQIDDTIPLQNSGMRQQAADARNRAILAAQGPPGQGGWNFIATNGETGNAVNPDWNNAGNGIVYVSTDDSPDGHPDYAATRADLMLVPFNSGNGGDATPLPGASDPGRLEYYPTFSADGNFVAYTSAPAKGTQSPDGPYYNRFGEITIIPTFGGTPLRLVANDPVSCAGDDPSRGLINSWPKWSPSVRSKDGLTYYFLIFSSARKYPGQFDVPRGKYTPTTLDARSSQLYMATMVVDESGAAKTYSAVYLWNQNRAAVGGQAQELQNSNLTPAWDEFVIPPVVIPPPL
jgi:hypothetical protein